MAYYRQLERRGLGDVTDQVTDGTDGYTLNVDVISAPPPILVTRPEPTMAPIPTTLPGSDWQGPLQTDAGSPAPKWETTSSLLLILIASGLALWTASPERRKKR